MAATINEDRSGQVRLKQRRLLNRRVSNDDNLVSVSSLKLDRHKEIDGASLSEIKGLIGRSDAMQILIEEIIRVSQSGHSVLLTGPSGTGKTIAARAIHESSQRASRAFLAVNCAGIPESLLEGELFGCEKGAFTGATSPRRGLFEAASGGTLFLDEIGDMPLSMQPKVLTAIDEKRIRRLGSTSDIRCDVRIIAATKRDLPAMIGDGSFREDLYYRIAVLEVKTPALKERRTDIPLLVEYYLREEARAAQKTELCVVENDAMQLLAYYDWPGNIRELRNVVARLVAEYGTGCSISTDAVKRILRPVGSVTEGGIKVCEAEEVKPNESLDQYIDRVTLSAIHAAIVQTGCVKKAAARLRLNRANLYSRVKRAQQSQES